MASLSCVEAPLDCRDTWQRTCDELAESDLEGPEDDSDLCAGLLRKRPDALAFRWGSKSVMILEFTRGYDWRPDWHRDTDRYKTERYLCLRDKLLRCLGDGWSVEIVTFTLGVRGSYEEGSWTSHLAKFGLTGIKAAVLMQDLVTSCLHEHDEMLVTRAAALRNHNANSQV